MIVGNEEKVYLYIETLKHLTNLNRASEIKAGLILSFYGLLLGVVFQYLSQIVSQIDDKLIFVSFLVSWLILIAISIYWSFRCFMPHIEGKYKRNVFFFNDAIMHYGSIEDYSKMFYEVASNQENLYDQLGQQIYIHSKIVAQKIRDVNRSVKYLAVSFIPLVVLLMYTLLVVNPEL